MKKTYLLITMLIGLAFTGCEPMEDIHEEIDASLENVEGNLDYTLTEDDYEVILEMAYPNFSSEDEAKELIPVVLNENFPALGKGSSIKVGYDLYSPIRVEEYTVDASEYPESNYFASTEDVADFLDSRFDAAKNGAFKEVTYNAVAEEIEYTLDDDDLDEIAAGLMDTYPDQAGNLDQYGNFNRRSGWDVYWTDAMIADGIDIALANEFDAKEGELYAVTFETYGDYDEETLTVRFDGNNFVLFGTVDNATEYELDNPDDYYWIADQLEGTYPDATASMDEYENFERRADEDAYWSKSMIAEALSLLLDEKFPSAVDGDAFNVEYRIYNGSGGTETMTLVKDGDSYSRPSTISVVQETSVFAYTNGSWDKPFTFTSEDYSEMGQSYPNFSDEDEAMYKIAIFLGNEFPYAEPGDMVAVAYDFYDGGVSTEYAKFQFRNGEFTNIPSVIEQSLSFGNNGSEWVPDNTIKYTLSGDDYAYIASELSEQYPGPTESMSNYSNFEKRGNGSSWDDDMVLEAMNILLDEIAPGAEEGQKYLLTYAVYNGTNTTEDIYLIKTGGEWVLFQE